MEDQLSRGQRRRALKKAGRHTFKTRYWIILLICLFMAFFCDEYPGSFQLMESYNASTAEDNYTIIQIEQSEPLSDAVKNIQQYGAAGFFFEYTDVGKQLTKDVENANEGVLASLVNGKSQTFNSVTSLTRTVFLILTQGIDVTSVQSAVGMVLLLVFSIFVVNVIIVGERRWFLENRIYRDASPLRIAFPYAEKATLHVAWVMLLRAIKMFLWILTIVGGPIKACEYTMIPYILAENPDIQTKQCFKLAHEMMRGHKWNFFVFYISFWYWHLLNALTLGLVNVFFLNGYYRASHTEYYAYVREYAKEKGVELSELLNDEALYAAPKAGLKNYPGTARRHIELPFDIDYMREYALLNLVLMFFLFSFVGWCWEVGLALVQHGIFVNRGTMHGPWLPIYGTGGLMILVLLKRFRKKPVIHFLVTMVACGVLEYYTSYFLELFKGERWWDYSGYLLNLNGRICLEGLLAFAIGGTIFVYLLAPMIDNILSKIPRKGRLATAGVLTGLFCADFVYSHFVPNTGEGITDDSSSSEASDSTG